ncbi:MAG: phosphoribosylanthranilate isomerase [Melioribacteraceae bacterium]|nr:phosphoribosylanthranilate isomerase [Melioribacteraceae bacterium]WKZ69802.1 MAG: phosphoribosylanthranilate isomerase [Melioribacteraceae bacterium]
MQKPRVKICCISSIEEMKLAVKYGASAIGLVAEMPSGPGVISDELIEEIATQTPPGISTFLLTSRQTVNGIIEHQKRCKTNTIQIVDRLIEGTHKELKNALPGISIVQVIHVNDESSVHEAITVSESVDAILLDSGNQKLDVKVLGGTGKTHDWSLSKKIVESISKPVFLAGGLNPSNVRDAVETVKPFGIDLCSGVRTNGLLDDEKLREFFERL